MKCIKYFLVICGAYFFSIGVSHARGCNENVDSLIYLNQLRSNAAMSDLKCEQMTLGKKKVFMALFKDEKVNTYKLWVDIDDQNRHLFDISQELLSTSSLFGGSETMKFNGRMMTVDLDQDKKSELVLLGFDPPSKLRVIIIKQSGDMLKISSGFNRDSNGVVHRDMPFHSPVGSKYLRNGCFKLMVNVGELGSVELSPKLFGYPNKEVACKGISLRDVDSVQKARAKKT